MRTPAAGLQRAQIALMEDPLHALRAQLGARLAELDRGSPQQDLFAPPP